VREGGGTCQDRAMAKRLEKMRADMLKAVRDTARLNASKRDVETILEQLKNLDRSKPRNVLGTIADISALVGMALILI
jgi:ferritin-like protein